MPRALRSLVLADLRCFCGCTKQPFISDTERTSVFGVKRQTGGSAEAGEQRRPHRHTYRYKGVDVHPYLDGVLPKIRANWYSHCPPSVYPPIKKKGNVLIGFRLMKNGKITNVKFSKGSGDVALDRAAYAGIIDSSPLPPLPSGFACQYLELQFHFYYNPDKGDVVEEKVAPTLPCVTTTIRPAP